jgi:hypothetical protein
MGTAGLNPNTPTAEHNEDSIMIQKGRDFFFISEKSEKDVVTEYGLKMVGGFIVGSIMIVIGAFILIKTLNLM